MVLRNMIRTLNEWLEFPSIILHSSSLFYNFSSTVMNCDINNIPCSAKVLVSDYLHV